MAIWSLLAAAAPSIVSGVAQAFNKPKKSEYAADTGYIDKYIASMRGRQSSREVYHMAMQPALRAIGQQQRRTQRQIGYGVERAGLTGSGIEAQQRLTAGQTGLEAIQRAGESATQAQLTESRRLGQQVDAAEMQRGQMISAGEKAYERAQTQWRQGLISTAAQGVGAVAGAKFGEMAATQKLATKTATEVAKKASTAIDTFQKEGTGAQALGIVNELTKGNFTSLADVNKAIPNLDWDIVTGKIKTGTALTETKTGIEKQGANIRSTLEVIGETFQTTDIAGGDLDTGAITPIRTAINDAISKAATTGGMDAATRTKVLANIQEYVNSLEGAELEKSNLLVIDPDTGGGIKVRDKATLNKYFQRMLDKIPAIEGQPEKPPPSSTERKPPGTEIEQPEKIDKPSWFGYGKGQWAPGKFTAGAIGIAAGGIKKAGETIIPGGEIGFADIYGEKTIAGQPTKKTMYEDPTGKFSGDIGRGIGAAKERERGRKQFGEAHAEIGELVKRYETERKSKEGMERKAEASARISRKQESQEPKRTIELAERAVKEEDPVTTAKAYRQWLKDKDTAAEGFKKPLPDFRQKEVKEYTPDQLPTSLERKTSQAQQKTKSQKIAEAKTELNKTIANRAKLKAEKKAIKEGKVGHSYTAKAKGVPLEIKVMKKEGGFVTVSYRLYGKPKTKKIPIKEWNARIKSGAYKPL